MPSCFRHVSIFFFNVTTTTEIYTLSLHDAHPIFGADVVVGALARAVEQLREELAIRGREDRKSTRLNSSHLGISYAVFCLKKKTKKINNTNKKQNESGIENTPIKALPEPRSTSST